MLDQEKPVILFDGTCGLCNRSVKFIMKHQRHKDTFLFKPLQKLESSSFKTMRVKDVVFETLILLENGNKYERSDAVLRISSRLRFPLNLLAFLRYTPRFIRDGLYNIISRNRKRWFGTHSTCYPG